LTRSIHELGLMRRRHGYYWAKLIGAVLILIAWVVGFTLIGDNWWQLVNAGVFAVVMTQIAFLGHDAAHRQFFKSGRWNDWVSLVIANLLVGISYGWWQREHNRYRANPNKVGANPDVALAAIAMTPERAMRFRGRLMRWLVAHQGWYFFPILLLLGVSFLTDGIRRVISRDKFSGAGSRSACSPSDWADWSLWCSSCCPRGRQSRSSRCSWPSSVCTWAHRSRRTTSACRSCRPS
jgi:fatty acid desaturase